MVIMVTGLPGTGKSFFASRLADSLGATYLSSDIIRKKILQERQYSEDEKEKVYEEMLSRMEKSISNGNTVVLDATFYQEKLRDRFFKVVKENSAEFRIIKIEAEENIIRERLSRKREHSDADFKVYKLLSEQYQAPAGGHLVLQSGRDNINRMLEEALQYLKDWH